MEIPSDEDWRSEPWALDEEHAYNNLYGKTVAEALGLIETSSEKYTEDFYYLPSRVFGYYFRAYAQFLLSEAARDDDLAAGWFLTIVEDRAKRRPADLRPNWDFI